MQHCEQLIGNDGVKKIAGNDKCRKFTVTTTRQVINAIFSLSFKIYICAAGRFSFTGLVTWLFQAPGKFFTPLRFFSLLNNNHK